ncbi:MAG: LysM peptidoglycan-binding domain-containing protein [Candidatus Paceibacterota bacterium]|jgi:hypothetical protein
MREKRETIGSSHRASLLQQAEERRHNKNFCWIVVVLLLLMVVGKFSGVLDQGWPTPKNIQVLSWQKIQVQPGNTLWGIAKSYGEKIDAQLLIEVIRQKNGIDQTLPANKPILIPSAVKYQWDSEFSYPKNL